MLLPSFFFIINYAIITCKYVDLRNFGGLNMIDFYRKCACCPNECFVNRFQTIGICKNSHQVKVAKATLYFYEEPSISGTHGSGTIFFSGCNLECIYCQNSVLSKDNFGKTISITRLADIMLQLQERKAHNINLVTPTHFIPSIVEAIKIAKKKGLTIPIIYNTSGYEKESMLKLLDGFVDIYLTDFKYFDDHLAKNLSHVDHYVEIAKKALAEMVRQTGANKFDQNGLMVKGVIVRHLCLPSQKEDSKQIISYLYQTYQDQIYLSIMNQYTPLKTFDKFPFLNHTLSDIDYEEIINYALDIGIKNAYMQEGETCSDSFIPLFDLEGV